jgi:hypothetical protein
MFLVYEEIHAPEVLPAAKHETGQFAREIILEIQIHVNREPDGTCYFQNHGFYWRIPDKDQWNKKS